MQIFKILGCLLTISFLASNSWAYALNQDPQCKQFAIQTLNTLMKMNNEIQTKQDILDLELREDNSAHKTWVWRGYKYYGNNPLGNTITNTRIYIIKVEFQLFAPESGLCILSNFEFGTFP